MSRSFARRAAAALSTVAIIAFTLACHKTEDHSVDPDGRAVRGKCIRLKQSMFIVRSIRDDLVPAYLAPLGSAGDVRIRAGATIVIDRLLVRESTNGRETIVLGHCTGCEMRSPIALFYLFNSDWLWSVAHRENSPSDAAASRQATVALRSEQAEWCR